MSEEKRYVIHIIVDGEPSWEEFFNLKKEFKHRNSDVRVEPFRLFYSNEKIREFLRMNGGGELSVLSTDNIIVINKKPEDGDVVQLHDKYYKFVEGNLIDGDFEPLPKKTSDRSYVGLEPGDLVSYGYNQSGSFIDGDDTNPSPLISNNHIMTEEECNKFFIRIKFSKTDAITSFTKELHEWHHHNFIPGSESIKSLLIKGGCKNVHFDSDRDNLLNFTYNNVTYTQCWFEKTYFTSKKGVDEITSGYYLDVYYTSIVIDPITIDSLKCGDVMESNPCW
jgi:hypothetical protein